jgi:TP901 family phage tail tape measure protein
MAKKVAIEVEIKNIKRVSDLKSELKALRKEQIELEKYSKTGRFTSKKQEEQYLKNARAIKEKSQQLRNLNKNLKESTTNTTKATKASNGMAKQIVKGAAAIGVLVTAFRTVNRAISSVLTTFTEFEFVMAKVNAVSGATNEEFTALTASAEELGRTTFFTAEQVGQLQLNFSKLGFTAEEIMNAQQATLNLATATGSDLARSATVAGAAIRGFGLDASETERVVDVMAVSFASSAMDIEKFQTSMTKVAPIAKSAGFSLEDTTAIMSKLTDSGIEASIAGTSLRNILLKMQDPSSDLTKAFGRTIHGLDDLVPAMKAFVEQGGSMADVMEVVDLRQAAAFEQMLTTADGTVELRNALLDASGEGQRMADIVGDTLQGAFLKFRSALEGLSISIMKDFAGGLQSAVERAAEFFNMLAENSKTIVKIITGIAKLAKVIGIYKTVQLAANIATGAFAVATGTASVATSTFITRLRTLYATMLANPYIAVGALLLTLATDVLGLRQEVEETTDSWDEMNKTIFGEAQQYSKRQEVIEALKSELATVQDLQRAKIESNRLEQEIAAAEKSRNATRIQAEQNANKMFREGEQALKDAYIAQTMRDFERGIVLKERQQAELEAAITNSKIVDDELQGTQALIDKKKELNDVERELLAFKVEQMNLGLTTEKENAQIRRQLIEQEIADLRNLLATTDVVAGGRAKALEKLYNLEKKLIEENEKDKTAAFKEDVKRALLSGQSAEEAMKSVVRAQIMEAVAGFIASIFKNVPFPLNLILAAGASAVVGKLIDDQINKFEKGGMVEAYANGGMVHGKSHAQGGEKFSVGGRVVELEGGEAVINKRSTAMFKNQLSAMNEVGGGVKFADGGLMNMPTFAQSQFNAVGQENMMGAIGQSNRVVVVEADITDSQNTVGLIEAEATF